MLVLKDSTAYLKPQPNARFRFRLQQKSLWI
jgi:hypothetical protein